MVVYFDYPVHSPYDDCINDVIAWHKNSPLLAVGSNVKNEKGYVSFYLDEAELVENSKLEKSTVPVSLVWHPTRKILATGWKNGEISLWNEHDKECHDGPMFHRTTITTMQWNGTGSRLITADEAGLLLVWKVDQRGRLQQSPMFQNDLTSSVVQMVFKISIGADIAVGIAAAARAAVSGDESALDMFDWQKSGKSKFSMSHAESIQMYVATKDGNIHFLDERGKCNKCFQVEGSTKYLLYYESRDIVVTITETLMLIQHSLHPEGGYLELSKVKLSGNAINFQVSWAGPGLIVTCCKERVARIIDIDNDQNFVINLSGHSGFENTETINCLCYNQKRGVLAGGTNLGRVAVWKYHASKADDNPWELQPPSEVNGSVTSIEWGANGGLMAANSGTSVTILSESIMNSHFNDHVAAIQMTPNHLLVEMFPSQEASDLKTDIHIKGVYCTENNIAIWNRRKIAVYEVSENKSIVRSAGTFNSDASVVAMFEQNIYLIEAEIISIRTFQGTIKQELTFLEQEGSPCEMNICGSFLAVGTTKSILKIYDLSRREARQVSITKNLEDTIPNFGSIHLLKCNCNGTKVAFTSQKNFAISSFLYVWDVEGDTVQCFNFSTGTGSEHLDEGLANAQEQLTSNIKGYVPQSVFWDAEEPKLLVCEATKISPEKQMDRPSFLRKESSLSLSQVEAVNLIVTMFSTPDHGVIVQDHFNKDTSYSTFLGVHTPHYYFVQSVQPTSNQSSGDEKEERKDRVIRQAMRDFVGLENADDTIKKAMTDFSYLSAVGNMDDAFKAIKSIKSGSVWGNMARMCVKTKRLDVAMVCLGNMGNAIAAKAVRECQREESDLNVQVSMLAVQIGMYEEAEELYKESGRYDLLNKFYQASNQWEKAVECAESNDRIHLRTTHYQCGKYLEEQENYVEAIKHFERSETYRIEVPRMLFEDFEKLEGYISHLKDQKLFRWWAQYLESAGEMADALRYYELSQDYHAMVRIHCFCEELEKAEKICNDTGDKAACYHLARQLDSTGDIKGAIHYFSRAKAYSNAIRLAKENQLDGELMNMALLSSHEDMLDCARYFEVKGGMEDKAVILYHKGGRPSKAIDLAFKTEQFGALQLISEDLDENADPEVLKKCAEFFIDHDQFDKAVNLLVVARRFDEALEMCLDHHIPITEELAEKMTLPKEHPDAKYRLKVLEKVGEVAFKQGSFHLATKKFTQAGNKIKAMKALLKSGDTEKIVFFAGVSRQKEIYIMAANYLQSLDWRKDPEIMKGIINFYTKGRALDSLASFYDACAQVEIDEFQNYEKAFGALSEAYKCLSKAKPKNQTEQEERLASIKTRLTLMRKFIQAQKVYQTNVDESMKACAVLLDDPDIDIAVRVGDIYSFLVQHYASSKDYKQAYNLMADMRQRYPSLKLRHYIKPNLIEQVHRALDIPVPGGGKNSRDNGITNGRGGGGAQESDGEEVMEEVDDEIEDDDDMI